ncbi:membrane protein required for colicin V production [Polynucleobacter meluiroseus]|jgi:membrane protein required for colicin V production|uniref:Membrane protein required for colicin V production n=1 Tax=Polynucleobacter meluiroseus TaxID=1938814 RepID=A0A240E0U3_9BURK|nr:CvpA family protein [Polynucleobacter meluiroseus]SNX28534.1 membrane protein required for colicin V production [Polynucleobacter meluiroseus]
MDLLSTLKLTTVDYFTLVVLLVSGLVGLSRGLFKEVLALVSWVVASWVAYHYTSYLSTEWLSTFHLDELLSLGVSFLILFILTLVVCGLIGNVIQKIILSVGLSMTDRLLGLIFGLLRGGLIIVILATLAALTPIPQSQAWQNAVTRPAIDMAAGLIKGWLPADWAKQLGDVLPKITPTVTPSITIGI